MSLLELRALSEGLRQLGYPRFVSTESFRAPNFESVADILRWLALRVDPDMPIPPSIGTEDERMAFLGSTVAQLRARFSVVLHAQALYIADGHAARELLTLTTLLLAATDAAETVVDKNGRPAPATSTISLTFRQSELASFTAAAEEFSQRGSKLAGLLAKEPEARVSRTAAARLLGALASGPSAQPGGGGEYERVERSVRDALSSALDQASRLEAQASELGEDEEALSSKVSRRQAELGRSSKRLETLAGVRPGYMDEFERLEGELGLEHEGYVTKARNIDYLRSELAALQERERQRSEQSSRAMRKLQRQLREEEFRAFRGDEEVDDDEIAEAAAEAAAAPPRRDNGLTTSRVGAGAAVDRTGGRGRRSTVHAPGRGERLQAARADRGGGGDADDDDFSDEELSDGGGGGADGGVDQDDGDFDDTDF